MPLVGPKRGGKGSQVGNNPLNRGKAPVTYAADPLKWCAPSAEIEIQMHNAL